MDATSAAVDPCLNVGRGVEAMDRVSEVMDRVSEVMDRVSEAMDRVSEARYRVSEVRYWVSRIGCQVSGILFRPFRWRCAASQVCWRYDGASGCK